MDTLLSVIAATLFSVFNVPNDDAITGSVLTNVDIGRLSISVPSTQAFSNKVADIGRI